MERVVERVIRWIPDLALFGLALLAQGAVVIAMLRSSRSEPRRVLLMWLWGISSLAMTAGLVLRSGRVLSLLHGNGPIWARAVLFGWTLLVLCWAVIYLVLRLTHRSFPKLRLRSRFPSTRRNFLRAVGSAVYAAPVAALGYGAIIQRRDISLREHEIPIAGLHADLEGLRLVQITDIHMSAFFSRAELDYAIAMANETRAHIALVTGDLITRERDPIDSCLEGLAALRADAGLFGCLGNHEIYARVEDYVEQAGVRQGLRFLRGTNATLRFGNARLNLAGVDYQRVNKPYLEGAGKLIVPDACNVMLSHNPDVFDVAAGQGYDLTVSGHTHGGQVRVEILGADLNVARFFTPYVDGIYHKAKSAIFVSRGLGTIGIPARLGAPPEVTLLRLRRA